MNLLPRYNYLSIYHFWQVNVEEGGVEKKKKKEIVRVACSRDEWIFPFVRPRPSSTTRNSIINSCVTCSVHVYYKRPWLIVITYVNFWRIKYIDELFSFKKKINQHSSVSFQVASNFSNGKDLRTFNVELSKRSRESKILIGKRNISRPACVQKLQPPRRNCQKQARLAPSLNRIIRGEQGGCIMGEGGMERKARLVDRERWCTRARSSAFTLLIEDDNRMLVLFGI